MRCPLLGVRLSPVFTGLLKAVDALRSPTHSAWRGSGLPLVVPVRRRGVPAAVVVRHTMMVIPYKGVLARLRETRDHQGTAICHYTVFPTAVFNCNPTHIQLFRAVPLSVDRSRFECWELQ